MNVYLCIFPPLSSVCDTCFLVQLFLFLLVLPPYIPLPLFRNSSPVVPDVIDMVDVPLGGTLQLSCSILGVPPPDTISWTHNGTERPDLTIESSDTFTTLTLDDVEEDDGGVYQCIARNVVGENRDSTSVRVQCELYIYCMCVCMCVCRHIQPFLVTPILFYSSLPLPSLL